MIEVKIEVMINSPVEQVFERLINIPSYNDWMPRSSLLINSRQTSDNPVEAGTTFSDNTKIGIARGEITELSRPGKVKFRQRIYWFGQVIGESRPGYELEPHNGSTRLIHHAEGNFYGLLRLLEPVFKYVARAERKRTVYALKDSLELV